MVVTDALTEDPTLVLPAWRLELTGGLSEGSPASTSLTVTLGDERVAMLSAEQVELTLDADLGLLTGSYDLVVTDPFGREGRLEQALVVAGAPRITAVSPEDICHEAAPTAFTFEGEGFITVSGALPSATLGAVEYPVLSADGCEPVMGSEDAEVCASVTVELDPTLLPLGYSDVTFQNPAPLDCAASAPAEVGTVPSPTLLGLEPEAVCRYGGRFTLTGEDLSPDTIVLIDGRAPASVTWIDGGHVEVEVGELEPGRYDVTALSPDGCEVTLAEGLSVSEAPLLFAIDPPVLYSGGQGEVTAYFAELTGEITDAWITDVNSGERYEADWVWDPEEPSVLRAVPPTTLPTGTYELGFVQGGECQGDVGGTFRVRSPRPIPLDYVEPAFAWTFDHTPITIHTTDPIGSGEEGFEETPRAYLIGPGSEPWTTRILGVTWQGETELTATVPPGLEPGVYHLLIINPDEDIGYLSRAIEVTQEGPPRIDTVNPSALPNQGNQTPTPPRTSSPGSRAPTWSRPAARPPRWRGG